MNKRYFNEITGEITSYPFRVKTEEEFINDIGDDWRYSVVAGWDNPMDVFFGKNIEDTRYVLYEKKFYCIGEKMENGSSSIYSNYWYWSYDMVVNNKTDIFKAIYLTRKKNVYE